MFRRLKIKKGIDNVKCEVIFENAPPLENYEHQPDFTITQIKISVFYSDQQLDHQGLSSSNIKASPII